MKVRTAKTWLKVASLATFALLAGCGGNEPVNAVITIDQSTQFQTMSAWEATAQAGQDFPSFMQYQDKLTFDAVNELGINRLRLEVRSGLETTAENAGSKLREKRYEIINDNDDPFQIDELGFHFGELDHTIDLVVLPMRKLLNERGEGLFINLNYVDFGHSDFEHKDYPEEYAEFILAVFLHMRDKYGFVPDTVEAVLEPDTSNASWTAKQVAHAIVAASARLKANGFEAGFIAPSTTDAGEALTYLDEIATIAGAMEPIVEFSYHRYSGVRPEVLQAISERASRYGKQVSMLEWIGADQETLHQDLKLANVSSWQQYTLAYAGKDDGDAYYKVDSEESDPTITMGSRTRFLSQYFRYIRPGAVRLAASTTDAGIDPVAFRNPDGSLTVVLKASARGTAVLSALTPGRYSATYATDEQGGTLFQDSELTDDGKLVVDVPSAGVVTIYGRNVQSNT